VLGCTARAVDLIARRAMRRCMGESLDADRTVLLTRSGIVMDDQVRGPRSAQHLVDLST
jgi:hypothetical protein